MPVISSNKPRVADVQVRITRSYNQCFLHIDFPKDEFREWMVGEAKTHCPDLLN